MLFDPHVKYAKSIGVEDTKILYALLSQMEENHCNFSNLQELLNAILDLKKDDKCLKCKNAEKNAVCMPSGYMVFCWIWCFVGHAFKTPPLVGCVPNGSLKKFASFNVDYVKFDVRLFQNVA